MFTGDYELPSSSDQITWTKIESGTTYTIRDNTLPGEIRIFNKSGYGIKITPDHIVEVTPFGENIVCSIYNLFSMLKFFQEYQGQLLDLLHKEQEPPIQIMYPDTDSKDPF